MTRIDKMAIWVRIHPDVHGLGARLQRCTLHCVLAVAPYGLAFATICEGTLLRWMHAVIYCMHMRWYLQLDIVAVETCDF
jgi:hypothetical protein